MHPLASSTHAPDLAVCPPQLAAYEGSVDVHTPPQVVHQKRRADHTDLVPGGDLKALFFQPRGSRSARVRRARLLASGKVGGFQRAQRTS